MDRWKIRSLTESDAEAANNLNMKVHLTRNPPMISFGLTTDIHIAPSFIKSLIDTGHCYGAYDGDKLIATRTGYVRYPDHELIQLEFDMSKSSASTEEIEKVGYCMKHIESMMRIVEDKIDIFKHYNVDKALHMYGLSVDEGYTHQGLGLRITKHAIEAALERGVRCIFTRTTGAYSARIYEKLGFENIAELRYDEFLVDGKPVFTPSKPHDAIIMWGKLYPD